MDLLMPFVICFGFSRDFGFSRSVDFPETFGISDGVSEIFGVSVSFSPNLGVVQLVTRMKASMERCLDIHDSYQMSAKAAIRVKAFFCPDPNLVLIVILASKHEHRVTGNYKF